MSYSYCAIYDKLYPVCVAQFLMRKYNYGKYCNFAPHQINSFGFTDERMSGRTDEQTDIRTYRIMLLSQPKADLLVSCRVMW